VILPFTGTLTKAITVEPNIHNFNSVTSGNREAGGRQANDCGAVRTQTFINHVIQLYSTMKQL
jgi:hypothetical protein